jgi:hypothetical protein
MSDALHGYSPAKIVREVVAGHFSARGADSATPYLRQLAAKRAGGGNVALLRGVFRSGSKKKGQAPLLIDEMPRGRGLSSSTKGLQPCPESELCLRCF